MKFSQDTEWASSCCSVPESYSELCSGVVHVFPSARTSHFFFAHVQRHAAVSAYCAGTSNQIRRNLPAYFSNWMRENLLGWAHEKVISTARYQLAVLLLSESSFAFEAVASQSACSAECIQFVTRDYPGLVTTPLAMHLVAWVVIFVIVVVVNFAAGWTDNTVPLATFHLGSLRLLGPGAWLRRGKTALIVAFQRSFVFVILCYVSGCVHPITCSSHLPRCKPRLFTHLFFIYVFYSFFFLVSRTIGGMNFRQVGWASMMCRS